MKLLPNLVGAEEPAQPKTQPAARPASGHSKTEALSLELIPIPDHELLERIGGGSYGDVWLARSALGAYRAVKIIHRQNFEDDRPFEREFNGIQKFEPISRSHDGLVDILQVGRQADYFYYVMELADNADVPSAKCHVSGEPSNGTGAPSQMPDTWHLKPGTYVPRTLRAVLKERGRLPVDECVEIAIALSSGLAHLHQHGLVHRDIKPSNIIFVQGVPKLADVGLVTDADTTLSYVGTEGYIPPEGPGAARADIFSLGKVLYEMATGQDRRQFPDLPPNLKDWPDQAAVLELNDILVKACARDARQRYESAEEMQAELALLQRGESVKAQRATRRRIMLFSRLGLAAVALALLLAGGWFVSTNVNRRKPGSTERKSTPAQQQEARRLYDQATSLPFNTQAALDKGIELLNRAIIEDPNHAQAYAQLAYCYGEASGFYLPQAQTMSAAKVNALRALQLDDALPTAHLALAQVLWRHELDLVNAALHFQRAIEITPNNGDIYGDYAMALSYFGHFAEADQVLKRGEQVNANAHNLHGGRCWLYYLERDFQNAKQTANRLLTVHSNSIAGLIFLASAHEGLRQYDEALVIAQRLTQIDRAPDTVAFLGRVHARLGHRAEALQALEELRVLAQPSRSTARFSAQVLLALEDHDHAVEHLQRAVDEYPPEVLALKISPFWDELRSDARFVALLSRKGSEK